jgi:NitT/TauT family transport system ATP-binding protein
VSALDGGAGEARPLVEMQRVSKIYAGADGRPTWALRDVSFAITQGEFACVIGPSGGGKTTILNIIAGFTPPTEGKVTLSGEEIDRPGPDRGVVFQEYALFAWLTARQNVEFGLRVRGVDRATRRAKSAAFLKVIGLEQAADKYPNELSGGMRQRIALARALINEPALLLMDEPFAAVDAITRANLQEELLRIWQRFRLSILLVTHNIEEAVFLANRVIVMSASPGQIRAVVDVDLPYPRDRRHEQFSAAYARVSAAFHEPQTPATEAARS